MRRLPKFLRSNFFCRFFKFIIVFGYYGRRGVESQEIERIYLPGAIPERNRRYQPEKNMIRDASVIR